MKEHTSLELSKRLHDKGFRGEHKYGWITKHYKEGHGEIVEAENFLITFPAYTFTELWGVLLREIVIKTKGYEYRRTLDVYKYSDTGMELKYHQAVKVVHESPTEAVGLLLEWLIDEGYYLIPKMLDPIIGYDKPRR